MRTMGWLFMTQSEYLEFHKRCTEKMYEITKNKNTDYCHSTDNAFSNFSIVSSVGIASTEQGFLTRIMDKICRINSFVQKGFLKVSDESVEDTLLDLANYCLLFAGYLKSKKYPEEHSDRTRSCRISEAHEAYENQPIKMFERTDPGFCEVCPHCHFMEINCKCDEL